MKVDHAELMREQASKGFADPEEEATDRLIAVARLHAAGAIVVSPFATLKDQECARALLAELEDLLAFMEAYRHGPH